MVYYVLENFVWRSNKDWVEIIKIDVLKLVVSWFHAGIICAEGGLWRNQRRVAIDALKVVGVVKTGHQRKLIETLIEKQVTDFIEVPANAEINT